MLDHYNNIRIAVKGQKNKKCSFKRIFKKNCRLKISVADVVGTHNRILINQTISICFLVQKVMAN